MNLFVHDLMYVCVCVCVCVCDDIQITKDCLIKIFFYYYLTRTLSCSQVTTVGRRSRG